MLGFIYLRLCFFVEIPVENTNEKKLPRAGLEPAIACSDRIFVT